MDDEIAEKAREMVDNKRKVDSFRAKVEADVEEHQQALIDELPDVDEFVKRVPPGKSGNTHHGDPPQTRDRRWFIESVKACAAELANRPFDDVSLVLNAHNVRGDGTNWFALLRNPHQDMRSFPPVDPQVEYQRVLGLQADQTIAELQNYLQVGASAPPIAGPGTRVPTPHDSPSASGPAPEPDHSPPSTSTMSFEGATFHNAQINIAQGLTAKQSGASRVTSETELEALAELVEAVSVAMRDPVSGLEPEQVDILRVEMKALLEEIEKGDAADTTIISRAVGVVRDICVNLGASAIWAQISTKATALIASTPWL